MSGQTRSPARESVSRSEFEQFERVVAGQFSEVRDAIGSLGRKLDGLASKPTDWKTIFGGLSMMATIIIAIGGIIAWGLTERINSVTTRAAEIAVEHNSRFQRVEGIVERGLTIIDEKMVQMAENRWSRRNQMDFVEPRLQALEARLREMEKENP